MSFPNWCNSSLGRSWASLKYTEEDERERWRLKVKIRRFVKISIEKILFWCQLIQLKEVHRTELKRRNRKRDRFVRLFCLGNNSTFYFYTVISTRFVDFFFLMDLPTSSDVQDLFEATWTAFCSYRFWRLTDALIHLGAVPTVAAGCELHYVSPAHMAWSDINYFSRVSPPEPTHLLLSLTTGPSH